MAAPVFYPRASVHVLLSSISLQDGMTASLWILPLDVSWHRLHNAIPTPGPEQSAHSHGRTAGKSCPALCSLQGLNV